MGWPRTTSSFPEPTSWNGDDDRDEREPAPCELGFPRGHPEKHPRYPSGWCIICSAPPEGACRFYGEPEEGE